VVSEYRATPEDITVGIELVGTIEGFRYVIDDVYANSVHLRFAGRDLGRVYLRQDGRWQLHGSHLDFETLGACVEAICTSLVFAARVAGQHETHDRFVHEREQAWQRTLKDAARAEKQRSVDDA
jgi:hypothetical protein